jgi:hypothetical protein
MAEQNCENCAWRAKYDMKPHSILGKLWKWHTGFCPGWKSYMSSLPENERIKIAQHYNMKKFMLQ